MNNLLNVYYSRNFLASVICRVDFFNLLTDEQVQDSHLHKLIMRYYPRKGMNEIIQLNHLKFNMSSSSRGFSEEKQNLLQITFSSTADRNIVKLTNSYLLFEIKDYKDFGSLFSVYSEIVSDLYLGKKITARRIGLRYINSFDRSSNKIYKSYFSPAIAVALDKSIVDHDQSFVFTRSMHRAEYLINDMQLVFNYGLNNKSYPNGLSDNSEFMLDYDCYLESIIDKMDDALHALRQAHSNIQTLFEASITSQLRKYMESNNE